MARLIDADIDAENYVTVWETDGEYGKQTVMAVDDLQYLPTIDAVEVVHGHWIGKPIAGYSTVRCSCCLACFRQNSGKWKYYPSCGAKMDGESRNDDA